MQKISRIVEYSNAIVDVTNSNCIIMRCGNAVPTREHLVLGRCPGEAAIYWSEYLKASSFSNVIAR